MNKSKLCSFIIAGLIGFVGIVPMNTFASEVKTETKTQSETKDEKDNNFNEKMNKASEQWKKLTAKQKDVVYALLQNQMNEEIKLMDKLVEFGVMDKEDAEKIQAHMLMRFKKMKESGEFPLMRQKSNKRDK
jgi:predicted transcriptional regulator YheO